MITKINEFKIYFINEASYDQLKQQFVDSNKLSLDVFEDIKKNIFKSAYGTWIIKMILNNIILPEDVYKYKEYFDIFDRNKNKYNKKDINQYKTSNDLNEFLSKTLEIKELNEKDSSTIKGVSKEDKYSNFKIGNVDGFNVYMLPQNDLNNYNVSCDLGSGTEWCTATGNIRKYYDNYIKKGPLFICIKGNEKYQFAFESNQFMDKNDHDIYDDKELNNKPYIYNIFKLIIEKYPNYKIPFKLQIMFDLDSLNYDNLTEKEWFIVSKVGSLSEEFIKKYQDKVDWFSISKFQKLSEPFIREFQDYLEWDLISFYQKLSDEFIREFKNKVDWSYISTYQKLSVEFIREFKNKVDWSLISKHQKLSEEFIREFKDKVHWSNISSYQKLSESFIREFKHKLNWYNISYYQKLSEEFIIEFKDKVKWTNILNNQNLSFNFIIKNKELLDLNAGFRFDSLLTNLKIPMEDKLKLKELKKNKKL